MSKQPVCPQCGNDDCLAIEVKVEYDLNWRNDEYVIGKKTENDYYIPSRPDSDSICSCGSCGWQGEFRDLEQPKTRYEITVTLELVNDLPAEEVLEKIRQQARRNRPLWDLELHESISIDNVKLLEGATK